MEADYPSHEANHKAEASESSLLRKRVFGGLAQQNTVDETRTLLRVVQIQISSTQAKLDRVQCKLRKSKSDDTKILRYNHDLERLRARKVEYNAAIPSMSPVKKLPVTNSLASVKAEAVAPALEYKFCLYVPPVEYSKPIVPAASGSNIRLPNDTRNSLLTRDVMERLAHAIPAIAPLPKADDCYDGDGDYYGRGKDLFHGPVAKADE
jgi:hypothetical protein